MDTIEQPPLDAEKLQAFVFRAVDEVGATLNAALVVMGDKLGLYGAMAGAGPLTPADLAARTGTAERYIREWLNAQAAGGYVDYDPGNGCYTLPPEQAMALADESSPAFLPGFFQLALGSVLDSPRITEAAAAARASAGTSMATTCSTAASGSSGPATTRTCVSSWLPALEGVIEKLQQGACVADVGCGHGASTILMAQTFPASSFRGFDYHDPVDRDRASPGRGGRRRRSRRFRSRARRLFTRGALRPGDHVRLPARHGRPGRRREARAPGARTGRHVDDRRAVRRRPDRGQPEPGRPSLLRLLDVPLHALVALSRSRTRARRASG